MRLTLQITPIVGVHIDLELNAETAHLGLRIEIVYAGGPGHDAGLKAEDATFTLSSDALRLSDVRITTCAAHPSWRLPLVWIFLSMCPCFVGALALIARHDRYGLI